MISSYNSALSFCKIWASTPFNRSCLQRLIRSSAVQHKEIHNGNLQSQDTTQTVQEVVGLLEKKVGASKNFLQKENRKFLFDLLPKSQNELPARTMKDSWDSAIIPLGSDLELREKYVTFLGGVRIGRLLEDMDYFSVWLCYKHILNPLQKEGGISPYSVVTALVDRIDFNKGLELKADQDIRIEGHVSWAGKSSMEATLSIKQQVNNEWKQVTGALFVLVARDPLNQGSAIINPLKCETEEEKEIFHHGEINKYSRKLIQDESLFVTPPNESEKTLVHEMFMKMASKEQLSFGTKDKPSNSTWMDETKLKNILICHPESRNVFNKIFGGFLMRQAFELSYANAYVFSKQRPLPLYVDDILFRKPVEVGSLLYLSSQVVYTCDRHIQISTKASVVDAVNQTSNLTNIFSFTFGLSTPVDTVIPRTYHEAMLFLDGRRHYQLVRGMRKFYAQGENARDAFS